MNLTYISEGNDKTACWSFDLPAKETCPGATEFCASKCYAFKLAQAYPAVGRKYSRNKTFTFDPEFVPHMIRNIPHRCEFRIHVSGDFFSAEYIQKWIRIAASRKDVTFYCYTRSWRNAELLPHILALNALENVNVNLSLDSDTGIPSFEGAEDFRWAFLTGNDTVPIEMRRTDIVFRTNHNARQGNHQWARKRAVKRGENPDVIAPLLHNIGGGTVCPFERGREMPANFSCSRCRLCIKKPEVSVCM